MIRDLMFKFGEPGPCSHDGINTAYSIKYKRPILANRAPMVGSQYLVPDRNRTAEPLYLTVTILKLMIVCGSNILANNDQLRDNVQVKLAYYY
jgi:hypothetical protein